jgi:CheY-like chemotaxis protein
MIFFTTAESIPLIMNDTPSGLKRISQDAMEVKFWEIYLLRNRNNLYSALCRYALDKGPMRNAQETERVVFRFMKYDWDRTLVQLLTAQSVPFEILRTFKTDVFQYMTKKKVYVAEDDLNILFALEVMLEEAGYEVTLSHCGNPILENYLPATDLFILDNFMPGVNGIDVCRHLKNQSATEHIPVIMISAIRNSGPQARKAGVDEFLEKPFQMQQLLQLVAKYTQGHNQLVEHER